MRDTGTGFRLSCSDPGWFRLTVAGDAVLTVPAVPGMLFVMRLLFLISGQVTPRSLERKGPRRLSPIG